VPGGAVSSSSRIPRKIISATCQWWAASARESADRSRRRRDAVRLRARRHPGHARHRPCGPLPSQPLGGEGDDRTGLEAHNQHHLHRDSLGVPGNAAHAPRKLEGLTRHSRPNSARTASPSTPSPRASRHGNKWHSAGRGRVMDRRTHRTRTLLNAVCNAEKLIHF
jgi:hypothetical protein